MSLVANLHAHIHTYLGPGASGVAGVTGRHTFVKLWEEHACYFFPELFPE